MVGGRDRERDGDRVKKGEYYSTQVSLQREFETRVHVDNIFIHVYKLDFHYPQAHGSGSINVLFWRGGSASASQLMAMCLWCDASRSSSDRWSRKKERRSSVKWQREQESVSETGVWRDLTLVAAQKKKPRCCLGTLSRPTFFPLFLASVCDVSKQMCLLSR